MDGPSVQSQIKYDFAVDMSNLNTSHTLLLRQVPAGANILEFGCSTGYMTRYMVETLGGRVTGVELNLEAAEQARPFCARLLLGDAEALDYAAELGDERFDVIMFADVLEHLKDPWTLLRTMQPFLAPGGRMLVSLPNMAHGDVRLSLLAGEFRYRPLGLLDNTHVRFFTRETVYSLFEETGYEIVSLERTTTDLFTTELQVAPHRFPSYLIDMVRQQPEATTYQFVVQAIGAKDVDSARALDPQERRAWRDENSRLRQRVAELEAAATEHAARDEGRRLEIAEAHRKMDVRFGEYTAESHGLRHQIEELTRDLEAAQAEVERLRASHAPALKTGGPQGFRATIKASLPFRALRAVRRMLTRS